MASFDIANRISAASKQVSLGIANRIIAVEPLRAIQLATVTAFIYLLGVLSAILTHLMLYADGAWFVFSIAAGSPWAMKWSSISARFTTYILTVLPTEEISHFVRLSPMQIADLNGAIFYGVPAILFVVACIIAYNHDRRFLIFPVLQTAFGWLLCYGFPSEILMAPNLLWIALFLASWNKASSIAFVIPYTLLLFSHELALPASLIVAWVALRRARQSRQYGAMWAIIGAIGLPILALIAVRLWFGGAGSDDNAVYVFDPRRVFNSPVLLIAAILLPVGWFIHRYTSWLRTSFGVIAIALAAAIVPFALALLYPPTNFANGRYDDRTIIAISMFILAFLFALLPIVPSAVDRIETFHKARKESSLPALIFTMLAIQFSSAAIFLSDWEQALGVNRHLTAYNDGNIPDYSIQPWLAVKKNLPEPEAAAIDRNGFTWALPFRSFVLADGKTPSMIVYGDKWYRKFCVKQNYIDWNRSLFSRQELDRWILFTCQQPEPILENTKLHRIKIWFAQHI